MLAKQPLTWLGIRQLSDAIKEYGYRPRKWQTLFLFLLALAGNAILIYLAVTLDGPVSARGGSFRLEAAPARILFGACAVLFPIGWISLGAMAYAAFAWDRRIALTRRELILPRPTRIGLSREEIQIPLKSISLVSVHDFIGSTKVLRLDYDGGTAHIPSNMLSSRAEFDELCEAVHDAVGPMRT